MIRFGLALDFGLGSAGPGAGTLESRFAECVELARHGAGFGFSSVWAGERYPSAPPSFHLPDPLLPLAALSTATPLRIGTGVLLLSAWDPRRLAYEAAVLDQLSGGRLVLGVALGDTALRSRFGLPEGAAARQLEESLRLLRALWRGESRFSGEYFRVAAGIWPLPRQPGGPPLLVGGARRVSARRAARLGDGYYASTSYGLSLVARQAEIYRDALGDTGSPPHVAANRLVLVTESKRERRRLLESDLLPALRRYADLGLLRGAGQVFSGREDPRRLLEEFCLVGCIEEVGELVQRYEAAGVTHIHARVRPNRLDKEAAVRTIELLGDRIGGGGP